MSVQAAAVKYLNFGWNVIPLFNLSKNPAPIKWKDFQTTRITPEIFNQLCGDQEPTGLGVITGDISRVIVIDEDRYKTDGKLVTFDSPMISQTASGGRHLFFKPNPAVKTSGFRSGINVEIKAEGGFAVLPPSDVITKNNTRGRYKWVKKEIDSLDELPMITPEMVAPFLDSNPSQPLMDLIEVGFGEQHNSLRTLTLKILGKFKPEEWERFAFPQIYREARAYDPPHPEWRVKKMIEDCSKFVLKRKNLDLQPKQMSAIVQERMEERKLEKSAPSTGYPGLDRIVKGHIPGHVIVLTGTTNTGKTSMACNLAHRLSKQNKDVLYFSLEPGTTILDYLASIRTRKPFDMLSDEDLSYGDNHIHVYFKDQINGLSDLINVVEKLPTYSLVVIDHIGYFITDTQGWLQQQSNTMKQLALLAKRKKTTILVIAHMRKRLAGQSRKETVTMDDIAGSASFKQDATEVFLMRRDVDPSDPEAVIYLDSGILVVAKTKAGPNGKVRLKFHPGSAVIDEESDNIEQLVYAH